MSEEPIKVFWTGGWDSTYRICYLTLVENKPVQPYYIQLNIQICRFEEYIMDKITKIIRQKTKNPDIIKDTIKLNKNKLLKYAKLPLKKKFNHLGKQGHFGIQYYWLIHMAIELKLDNLEVCIEKSDNILSPQRDFFIKECNQVGQSYRIKDNNELINKDMEMFKSFSFPLFDTTKIKMKHKAMKYQFLDIMKLTWSCFNPVERISRDNRRYKYFGCCGYCSSCKENKKQGVGFLLKNTIRFN
jgi:hypothetical protein